MYPTSVFLAQGSAFSRPLKPGLAITRPVKYSNSFNLTHSATTTRPNSASCISLSSNFRVWSSRKEDAEGYGAERYKEISDGQESRNNKQVNSENLRKSTIGSSFLAKLAIALGVAATITIVSICLRKPSTVSSQGFQFLAESTSSPAVAPPNTGFSFKAFGYIVAVPEYAPGWLYFWLLMAAGCGIFISEEALNIWVGISLWRLLSLDGTWQSFAESLSRNSTYIVSTVLWVYWGVCISDMIPFYLGKLFRQTGASDDVCSKLGIGKEKAMNLTRVVQRYGNLIGFVERFSLGVRNPTAFLAGASGISPDCFFAGVCFGGLITLSIQLAIGFLLRERPVFALATVATVVGIWTIFPYAVAGATALVFYLRRRSST